ncbi:cyclic AMP-responsive element-binding protein 3-like protein 2 isoform X2 [Acanthaster planci]|uniref:Cyclic AMP-responsive element-binding protein 3-like protein 2 isoform X2 n=1 Tax=Acanthaster planci TaxID=133434 RepID=A0A8B8A4F4_ACAPL|nr:cyclic AMP-responsive element-binding protein 3-like protein 2 isoform X2 [Acanthaster planci]
MPGCACPYAQHCKICKPGRWTHDKYTAAGSQNPTRFTPISDRTGQRPRHSIAMDDLLGGNSLYDGEESDFKYILDSDVFHNVPLSEQLEGVQSDTWFNTLFDDPMLCDRDFGAPSPTPHIQAEHSYSLSSLSEPDSPVSSGLTEDELDTFDLPLVDPETNLPLIIKSEPLDDPTEAHFVLKEDLPRVIFPTPKMEGSNPHGPKPVQNIKPKQGTIKIKVEPMMLDMRTDNGLDGLCLPPTPPSSTTSDSEGGNSPSRQTSEPGSPRPLPTIVKKQDLHSRMISTQPLFTNTQRLPQSGPLILTEEEKRTLIQEGYPIPTKLPLTKSEEKSLKKVRRKIKNKISAQESRRKKKEYVEALERKMETFTQENSDLKRKLQSMESTNRTLAAQLQKLQSIVNKVAKPLKANSTQSSTCLMVLVLCFAVFLGGWSPQSLFGNSNLPKMPSTPGPQYGPFPSSYYASMHYHDNLKKEAKTAGQSGIPYGPEQHYGPYYGPYISPSVRSSRMLFSNDDSELDQKPPPNYPYMERMNPLDHGLATSASDSALRNRKLMVPRQHPETNTMATTGSFLGSQGSGVNPAEAEGLVGLQAVMHPDIEAQLVAMDSVTRLTNNSKNK